jgi:hypothetical protein
LEEQIELSNSIPTTGIVSISALIFDLRVVSNARIIPRKSEKNLTDSDISFLGLPLL